MSDCPYTWRVFAAGVVAGVWSVVFVTAILGAAFAKRRANPNP